MGDHFQYNLPYEATNQMVLFLYLQDQKVLLFHIHTDLKPDHQKVL